MFTLPISYIDGALDIRPDNTVNFNGSSDYLTISDNATLDLGTSFTISCWANFSSLASNSTLFSQWEDTGEDRNLRFNIEGNSNKVRILLSPDGTNSGSKLDLLSTSTLSVDTWYHIASTYDGANAKIYINGVEDASDAYTSALYDSSSDWEIGASNGGAEPMDGNITEVMVFNDVISISELYNSSYAPRFEDLSEATEEKCVMSIPLHATAVNPYLDQSGNDNDALVVGGPTLTTPAINVLFESTAPAPYAEWSDKFTKTGELIDSVGPDWGDDSLVQSTTDNKPTDGGGFIELQANDFLNYTNTIGTVNDFAVFMEIEYPATGTSDGVLLEYNDVSNGGLGISRSGVTAGLVLSVDGDNAGFVDTLLTSSLDDTTTVPLLNGTSQSFSAADSTSLSMTGDMTLAAWINPEDNDIADGIIGKYGASGGRSYVLYRAGTEIRIAISSDGVGGSSLSSTVASVVDTWIFVMCRLSGTNLELSIDDGAKDSMTHNGGVFDSTTALTIGDYDVVGDRELKGSIAFSGVWDRALSNAEVTELYNSGVPRSYAAMSSEIKVDCSAFWDLDTASGDELADKTGNGNHLTNIGSTPFTVTSIDAEYPPLGVTKLVFRVNADNTTDIFQNGTLAASGTWVGSNLVVDADIFIGGETVHFGTCDIHNMKIFDRHVTDAQLIEMTT